jgi:hypothetical protein
MLATTRQSVVAQRLPQQPDSSQGQVGNKDRPTDASHIRDKLASAAGTKQLVSLQVKNCRLVEEEFLVVLVR